MAAFAAGDEAAVLAGSAATIAALAGAEEIGRGRATTAGVVAAIVVVLLILLLVVAVCDDVAVHLCLSRRRPQPARPLGGPAACRSRSGPRPPTFRRRRPESRRLDDDPLPPGDAVTGFAADDPYATLAATPDPRGGSEAGEPGARGAEPD